MNVKVVVVSLMQRSQALKPIYTAVSEPAALAELEAFEASPWGRKYPTVV